MNIQINGEDYAIPPEEETLLLKQIQALALKEYEKLSQDLRFLAKPLARSVLQKMENEARAKYGREASLFFRPEKRQDAVVHLSGVVAAILQEALKHVTLSVSTVDHTVAAFQVTVAGKGPGGGPVATHGYIGQRENHSTQVS